MKRKFLIFFFVTLNCSFLAAQTFELQINEANILVNQPFEVAFILTGGTGSLEQFPSFNGFQVLRGPDKSEELVNIQGNLVNRVVYRFELQAARPGTKIINTATVNLNNEILSTDPQEIRVNIQQEELSDEDIRLRKALERSLGENIRFESTLSSKTVYLGEPITLSYDLWIDAQLSGQVGSISRESTPQFQGFSAIPEPSRSEKTLEIRNGKRFLRTKVSKYRLIPQSIGTMSLDTMQVGMTVAIPRSGRIPQNDLEAFQRQFQPGFREYRFLLSAKAKTITIRPLPTSGKPVDFSGLVGEIELEISIPDSSFETGEEGHIILTLTGLADYGLLSPPQLNYPTGFEGFPPTISAKSEGSGLVLDYAFVPRQPGTFSIDLPMISTFNPSKRNYQSLGGGTIELVISGESLSVNENNQDLSSSEVVFQSRLLKHVDGIRAKAESWILAWFWGAILLPWLLLLGLWLFRKQQIRTLNDPDFQKHATFQVQMEREMKRAVRELRSEEPSAGYAALHHVLWLIAQRYLGIGEADQTEARLTQELTTSAWPLPVKTGFQELMATCRTAGFGSSEVKKEDLPSQIKALLSDIEKTAPPSKPQPSRSPAWIGVLLLLTSPVFGQNEWTAASSTFDQKQYAEAATMYEDLYQSGKRSVDLFHNWGTAAYQNGAIGRAVWAYEKALRYEPGMTLSRNNLEAIRRQLRSDILPRPDLPFEQDFQEVIARVGPAGWSWLAVCICGSLVGFLAFSMWFPILRPWRTRLIFLLTVGICLSIWLRIASDPERPNGEGIVIQKTIVREAPEGQRELISLPAGVKVYVGEVVSGWQEVKILHPESGELTGYVKGGTIASL